MFIYCSTAVVLQSLTPHTPDNNWLWCVPNARAVRAQGFETRRAPPAGWQPLLPPACRTLPAIALGPNSGPKLALAGPW